MKPGLNKILALGLIAAGFFLGRMLHGHAADSSMDSQHPRATELKYSDYLSPPRSATAIATQEKHDLTSLAAKFDWQRPPDQSLEREAARLSTEELEALALDQLSVLAEKKYGQDYIPRLTIVRIAITELYHRQGMAVMDWAAALDGQELRRLAMDSVLDPAIKQHPDAAIPWLKRMMHDGGRNNYSSNYMHAQTALKAALERGGTEEFARVARLLQANSINAPSMNFAFPEDTDYAALDKALGPKVQKQHILDQWAAKDRDAAWQAALEGIRKESWRTYPYFIAVLNGAMAGGGEKEGVEWAMTKLPELPETQRSPLLRTLASQEMLSTKGLAAMVTALEPQDRLAMAKESFQPSRSLPHTLILLESLPRGEMLDMLREAAVPHLPLFSPDSLASDPYKREISRLYHHVAEHFKLTAEEMQGMPPQ